MLPRRVVQLAMLSSLFLMHTVSFAGSENLSLEALPDAMVKGQIRGIEVIALSPNTLSRTRVTSEMLEASYYYKVEIRDGGIERYRQSLIEALRATVVEGEKDTGDLRVGLIFLDASGHRACVVYFDRFGHHGEINGTSVTMSSRFFKSNLASWLSSNFPFK